MVIAVNGYWFCEGGAFWNKCFFRNTDLSVTKKLLTRPYCNEGRSAVHSLSCQSGKTPPIVNVLLAVVFLSSVIY